MVQILPEHVLRLMWDKGWSSCSRTTWWFSYHTTRTNSMCSLINCYKCPGRQRRSKLVNLERWHVGSKIMHTGGFSLEGMFPLHFHFYCRPFQVISWAKQRQTKANLLAAVHVLNISINSQTRPHLFTKYSSKKIFAKHFIRFLILNLHIHIDKKKNLSLHWNDTCIHIKYLQYSDLS